MARLKVKAKKNNARNAPATEPGGLWHQPALMNLLADVLIVLAVGGLVWSALTALQRLPVFPLRELVLTSMPKQVSAEQLEHAARSAMVGNFFTIDLAAARTAFEKLPWVRKAAVRRQWPDGLSVAIEEHQAVARWHHLNGEPGLVNAQGEVFVAERPAGAAVLPQLAGPVGSAAEILARYAEFSGALDSIGRQVEGVALTPRLAWQLRLDDGVVIVLGRDQLRHPLSERLARFVAYYAPLKQRLGTLQVADMRYPNGFVLSGLETAVRPAVRPARQVAAGRKT